MFTRILNFDVATHNRQKGNCLVSALPPEKKKNYRSKEKKISRRRRDDFNIYKKEKNLLP